MRSYSICAFYFLASVAAFGASPAPQQADAQVLDRAAFLCSNCFFGTSDYYYCFATGGKILIGYQRAPVVNWHDESKNFLTVAHPGWEAWSAPGQTVPIRYDDKHVWVLRKPANPPKRGFWEDIHGLALWAGRSHGKQVRLTQSSKRDIFANNAQCRGAATAQTQ